MLELFPGKEFRITLKSGEVIEGKFSTWAYKRFCMKLGLSDKKLVARLSDDESSWSDNIEMYPFLPELVFNGAKYLYRFRCV